MIELRIDEICKDCPEFEPTQETLYYDNNKLVIITCANGRLCRSIRKYLKQKEAENGEYKPNA